MTSIGEKVGGFLGASLGFSLFALYITGVVSLVSDDHRYTSKNLIAGVVLFPYSWYIGGKTVYHFSATTRQHRDTEAKCLDYAEAQDVSRKARVFLCECVANGSPVAQCNAMYEQKLRD